MSNLVCLDEIIGLSRNECACYQPTPPGYNTSLSNLFLDELEGIELRTIKADVECGEGDVWNKMSKSVGNAKTSFRADLMAEIGLVSKQKRKLFNGLVGQRTFNGERINGTTYNGLIIRCGDIKGGEFTLKGINTLMNANASFDIEVWNNIQDTPLVTIPVTSLQNQLTPNVLTPDPLLTFPLWVSECIDPDFGLEYYIVYNPVGFEPKNNKVDCGCARKNEWEHWAYVEGVNGNDILDRERWPRYNYANGLVLDLQFTCNTSQIICGGENEPLDFENDAQAMVMAYAIRYKAGEILIEDILASGNINRYTMLAKERLWGKRNHYVKEYATRITYLATRLDVASNDCLMCGDDRIGVSKIFT